MNKILLIISVLLLSITVKAQDTINSHNAEITVVTSKTIREIAKNSEKKNTLFFTFGTWCEPCRHHLPTAIKLAKDYNLDLYVLLVDAQKDEQRIDFAKLYITGLHENLKIAILDDAVYGNKLKKRNKQFVTEVTPPQFENIDDFSKYILLNKDGEVIMVTNWKDNRDNDWRDDSKMVQQRIAPLLK